MSTKSELQSEEAVRDVMVRLREAWERGDGQAYAALFSEDAQYVTAPGKRLHGRKSIAQSHQEIFNRFFKDTKLGRSYPNTLRPITSDVVLVESAGSVLFPGETESEISLNGLTTFVLARQANAWRIVSFQNTPTGRHRSVRFIWRYLRSRLSVFRAEWSRGHRHMLENKHREMAMWEQKSGGGQKSKD
jgi:uncharacterized protein (TIGR02246 family)